MQNLHPNLQRALWGLLGLVLGVSFVNFAPRSWIFVEEEHQEVAGEKEIWACPMLCVRLDGPGTCPVCGMDLELLEDTGDQVILSEDERAAIALATEPATLRVLSHEVRSFGRVDFNQRRVTRISAWAPGRITKLFADTVYTDVRKGDHLFEMYSPVLYAAQVEYLSAKRGGYGRGLASAAREKLLLYGFIEAQIKALEASGEAMHTVTIHSPASGTIFELLPREGDYVNEGTQLYTIADYDTLWLLFDAYESDLPWVAEGQPVEVALDAWPGRTFHGTVEFIEKAVAQTTRTVKVRVVLDNPEKLIKPGMYASVTLKSTLGKDGRAVRPGTKGKYSCYMHPEVRLDAPGECPICGMPVELHADAETAHGATSGATSGGNDPEKTAPKLLSVPRTAILTTGERSLVYVMVSPPVLEKDGDVMKEVSAPSYQAREVIVGPTAGKYQMVLEGLRSGEAVVTQGAFMLDSQMELLGKPSLLHSEGSGTGAQDPHANH